MTVKQLRGWHPDWNWRPIRQGMGWFYLGTKGGRRCCVEATTASSHKAADWWVAFGDKWAPYEIWAIENMETV